MRDVEIARRRIGINIDGRTAPDPLYDPEPDVSDRQGPAEQVEFMPGRPAPHIEVGPETQRMYRLADHAFYGLEAAEIDDGDDLFRHVREAVILPLEDFRRPLDLV